MEFELRPWRADDAASVARYANNAKIAANLRDGFPYPYTLADAEWFVKGCMDADPARQCFRAVTIDGDAIGSVSLCLGEDVYCKSAELGYWLAEPFWQCGIMSAAVRQLCAEAFQTFDLARIYAEPFAHNLASRRVLEKAGFLQEGVLKNSVYKNGVLRDSCMYALTNDSPVPMKTIGLIGGMSWESTASYYRLINTAVKACLGGLHSAKLLLHSVDFAEIEACQSAGDWTRSAELLGRAAQSLERGGADFFLICTNTMHKVADAVSAQVRIPLLHIGEVTADALTEAGVQTAALLGTRYTMEEDFYTSKLLARGVTPLIPGEDDRAFINHVIFDELCVGILSDHSRRRMVNIVESLAEQGAQAAVLGCTEIGMLIRQEDTPVPLFDTTVLHAERAARLSLGMEA